ncbi:hypothetical protein AB8Z70_09070 [Klebsiella pneumoniae subsp. pneumoniae]
MVCFCYGGVCFCRSGIRLCAGFLRKLGYNNRIVAVVGATPVGINLLKGFMEEPWLGFVVKGIYDDNAQIDLDGVPYGGNLDALIHEAKDGRIDRVISL